jgi:hypothetical protein
MMRRLRVVRRFVCVLLLAVLIAATPAAIAPLLSDHPLLWAYRFYHPGMYRFPSYVLHLSNELDQELQAFRLRSGVASRVEISRRTLAKTLELRSYW